MIKKILPILLILVGTGGGIGAGLILKPEHSDVAAINPCGDEGHVAKNESAAHEKEEREEETTQEYVKLNNQFVVPVVANQLVNALVVMSLSVEIEQGQSDLIFTREPKLRDAFLQVLFDHANMGGFQGEFTNANNLDVLRLSLTEVAQRVVGEVVRGVLITEIARQDV